MENTTDTDNTVAQAKNSNAPANNNNFGNGKPKTNKKGSNRGYQYGKRDYFATGFRISNFPESIDLETLTKYFSQFGKLNGVNIKNAPNDTKVAEIDYSQKGCASKSVNSLINYDKEKSLFPEKPTIVQLHWNDDLGNFINNNLQNSNNNENIYIYIVIKIL